MIGHARIGAWKCVVPRQQLPIIVICRDLLSDLISLVHWLEKTSHENIILLDNNSSYPPLLEYLSATHHEVIRLDANLGHRSPWLCGLIDRLGPGTPFVVTDPDVIPDPEAPPDSFEYMQQLLLKHDAFDKAGFGLHIDDLPDHYPHRDAVIIWESPFWTKAIEPNVFAAHLDTTLALHRPGTASKVTESLRTGAPHMARHLPWYRDPRHPDEESAHYLKHRDDSVGYWNRTTLHPSVGRRLNRERQE
jgi:hypothetical protein